MARSTTRSIAERAGSVARRVVGKKAAGGTAAPVPKKAVAPAKKAAPAKKTAAKKAAPAKKAEPRKTVAKKTVATKAAPAKKAESVKAATVKTTPAPKPVTPETPKAAAKPAPARPRGRKGSPGSLVVLPTETSWTKAELDEVKAHLNGDIERLESELAVADADLHNLMLDSGDGAGHDQADVGSSSFERDHEMTIVNNAREMLTQSQHALERIADSSYGVCESCEEPIGKMRLLAFPRATLCIKCKQREERR